jgi:AraC family transcriptional regulator
MFLRIEQVAIKHFIGMSLRMSSAKDRSAALWRSFMPKRKQIAEAIGEDVYSIQLFDQLPDFSIPVSEELYTNWAAKEVAQVVTIPEGMTDFIMPAGLYAVFLHIGTPADFPTTARYIFQSWLPESGYKVENRPFFQVLSTAYHPGNSTSEEEVYIPIALI